MPKALKLSSLLISLVLLSPIVHADLNGDGGDISGMSDDGNKQGDLAAGCKAAGAGRLLLDTSAKNCNPGKSSVNGGQLPNDAGLCASPPGDGTSIPTIQYLLGGKPKLAGGAIDIPKSIDCSGMACAIACRAGMKWKPSGKECDTIGTADMLKDIDSGNSCFKSIPASSGLQPGDLVVYKHSGKLGKKGIGHVFIINSVDKEKKCFSINQAAGGEAKVGIETFCGSSPSTSGDKGMALKKCKDVMNGSASSVSDKVKVVRFDSKNRKCTFEGKKFKGEKSDCDVGRGF